MTIVVPFVAHTIGITNEKRTPMTYIEMYGTSIGWIVNCSRKWKLGS